MALRLDKLLLNITIRIDCNNSLAFKRKELYHKFVKTFFPVDIDNNSHNNTNWIYIHTHIFVMAWQQSTMYHDWYNGHNNRTEIVTCLSNATQLQKYFLNEERVFDTKTFHFHTILDTFSLSLSKVKSFLIISITVGCHRIPWVMIWRGREWDMAVQLNWIKKYQTKLLLIPSNCVSELESSHQSTAINTMVWEQLNQQQFKLNL